MRISAVFPALGAQPRVRGLAVPRDGRADGRELSDEPQSSLRCVQREHGVARISRSSPTSTFPIRTATAIAKARSGKAARVSTASTYLSPRSRRRNLEVRRTRACGACCSTASARSASRLSGGRDQAAPRAQGSHRLRWHVPLAALAATFGHRRRAGSEILGHHAAASSACRRAALARSSGRADRDGDGRFHVVRPFVEGAAAQRRADVSLSRDAARVSSRAICSRRTRTSGRCRTRIVRTCRSCFNPRAATPNRSRFRSATAMRSSSCASIRGARDA